MKFINEEIESYSISKSNTPSSLCNELEDYTRKNVDMSMMLIGKMEASFLGFLIRTICAKTIVEFGTFTGYSALAMAENIGSEGMVYTLDIDEVNSKIAKVFWEKSPHKNKITQLLGPAMTTIKSVPDEIDFIFIDADKENYLNYLKASLKKLSNKGMIVVDNVLWSGSVLKESTDKSTKGIQEINDFISNSTELYGTLLPIRDGMFLIKKI